MLSCGFYVRGLVRRFFGRIIPQETDPVDEVGLKDFEAILLEAVDAALMSFGESVRAAIYFHIDENVFLPRNAIPFRLADFCSGLQNIFGRGSLIIERQILAELCSKLGANYETVRGKPLQAAVSDLRKMAYR